VTYSGPTGHGASKEIDLAGHRAVWRIFRRHGTVSYLLESEVGWLAAYPEGEGWELHGRLEGLPTPRVQVPGPREASAACEQWMAEALRWAHKMISRTGCW